MPRCRIKSLETSPTFWRLFGEYQRRYPKTKADLTYAFTRIAEDPERAAHATRLIGFGDSVLKYRCKHSDLARGVRGGYRIIALYDRATATLTPLVLYAKVDQEDVSPAIVKRAVVELRDVLSASVAKVAPKQPPPP